MMFPGMAAAPRPPPPAVGPLAPFINVYNDPFRWSVAKSAVGFVAGVFIARQISSEVAAIMCPLAPFINVYNDPFRWSVAKSAVGFVAGVFIARQISSEVAAM